MQKLDPITKIRCLHPVIWLLLPVFIVFGDVPLQAQNADALFNEANNAYAQGNYQQAIDLYQAILEQGLVSGEVYFNLGNAYYKSNQIGYSILYYEKAKKYLDGDPSLDHNLKLARLSIVDEIDEIPVLFLEQWWLDLVHLFPATTYLWLCLAFFSLVILLLILRIFLRRLWLRNLIWIMLGLFFFSDRHIYNGPDI